MAEVLCPCTYCSRVANPSNCENKKCVPWQRWFLKKWEHTRTLFRVPYENVPMEETGIPLGGYRYSHPHRVQEYRENGPCLRCRLPKDLCTSACAAQRAWQQEKEAAHELES